MGKRLWDLAKSRIEIGTILPGHRHKVAPDSLAARGQGSDCATGWPTPDRSSDPGRAARGSVPQSVTPQQLTLLVSDQ